MTLLPFVCTPPEMLYTFNGGGWIELLVNHKFYQESLSHTQFMILGGKIYAFFLLVNPVVKFIGL